MSQQDTTRKHLFLQPALTDRFYVSGGWQIFNRMADLVGRLRDAELVTYRLREDDHRHLDDVSPDELREATVWVYWHTHFPELAERLRDVPRVVVFSQAWDPKPTLPETWPVVTLSRYLAAEWSLLFPWRPALYLGTALHPAATHLGLERDIDVVVHQRKGTPYLHEQLVPTLEGRLRVERITTFLEQGEMFRLLNRTKVYLYHFHRSMWGSLEGFGMQPLEAIVCGATPVSNAYGGLSDYLEPPRNCRRIATWSLDFDVAEIERAVREHDGTNPDAARLQELYGEAAYLDRFVTVERALDAYFARTDTTPRRFPLSPTPPPWPKRIYHGLYKVAKRTQKRLQGVRPR